MLRFFKLLSKLALVACGIFIGEMLADGFHWIPFAGVMLAILMHYLYIYEGAKLIHKESRIKITHLKPGDSKPDEMSEELWEKVQGLLEYSASNEGDNDE